MAILALRLYPPLPMNARMANKDTYLPTGGGPDGTSRVFVPEGNIVQVHMHSLQRRQDIYGPDAEEFRPERWASLDSLDPWAFLPFSNGPRICIGRTYLLPTPPA